MKFSAIGGSYLLLIECSIAEVLDNMETLVRILTSVDCDEMYFRNRLQRYCDVFGKIDNRIVLYMDSSESAESALSLLNAYFQ